MWKLYAVLSAFFSALVVILAKIGITGIDSNLATAVRTVVILLITWGIVFATGGQAGIRTMSAKNWTFLILSGLATALAWLFYFKALQYGDASKVSPIDKMSVAIAIALGIIVLGEPASPKVLIGGALIVAGSLVILSSH